MKTDVDDGELVNSLFGMFDKNTDDVVARFKDLSRQATKLSQQLEELKKDQKKNEPGADKGTPA